MSFSLNAKTFPFQQVIVEIGIIIGFGKLNHFLTPINWCNIEKVFNKCKFLLWNFLVLS